LPVTRRDLLKTVLATAGTAPLIAAVNERAPTFDFPTQPRQRLAVTSYPFRAYIESPSNRARDPKLKGFDLKEFPALMIEKFGIYNINPLGDHLASTEPAYLESFRAAVAKTGSHMVGLGLSGRRFYAADADVRKAAVEYGRTWVDNARILGSPSVRQHVSGRQGDKPDVALAAGSLGELAEYGARRNIVINLENDSPVAEDPFFLVAVIERVNNPYLRGLPDFGNSLRGHDAAYNQKAVSAMLKHAWNMCHVKDTLRTRDGQVYTVDLKTMFGLAKESSYRGYFSMEFDTGAGDPFTGTKHLVEETLKYLA
jgi:sugar phosphate isomerase/epimerase